MKTYQEVVERWYRGEGVVGIGSGRTVALLMPHLAQKMDRKCVVVGTSTQSELLIRSSGFSPVSLSVVDSIDVYFDGADYVDEEGSVIKGYGGAIAKEKICMFLSGISVIVAQRKKVVRSFEGLLVPVEILRDSLALFTAHLDSLGLSHTLQVGSNGTSLFVTENSNGVVYVEYNREFLLSCESLPGVVSHGLVVPSKSVHVVIVDEELGRGTV
ncbi:ribose 5-phosphate isomerase A [Nematocida displodere]|uniref:Ribose-5-phosphate isomerase n=1 Tax=Nematocida displodere TaxID=1805483 RepID=A0A177EKL3_9MICR|nr:ribose 5-phosphate isomerase A [Nematocida displodere]